MKNRAKYLGISLFFSVSCIFLVSNCTSIPPSQPSSGNKMQQALQDVSYYRDTVEVKVRDAKMRFKDEPEILKEAEKRYNTAEEQGNSFIEILQHSLTERLFSEDDLMTAVSNLDRAVGDLLAYIESVEQQKHPEERPMYRAVDIPSGIADKVTKAGKVMWEAARSEETLLVREIKDELEKRRWKSWGEI